MGQKFSSFGKKVLAGVTSVARQVPGIIQSAISGASTGAALGPWGALAGGIGGAALRGISSLDETINAVKGAGHEGNTVTPQHFANVVSDGLAAVKDTSKLKHLLPPNQQARLELALKAASAGKSIADKFAQTGKFAETSSNNTLNQAFRGRVRPETVEKMASPTYAHGRAMLPQARRREFDGHRILAHASRLQPVAVTATA